MARRIGVAALLTLGFGVGSYYTWLSHSEYAEANIGTITVYRGSPGQQHFQFPEPVWTIDGFYTPELIPASPLTQGQPLRIAYGQHALEPLLEQLLPPYRAAALLSIGRANEAMALLRHRIDGLGTVEILQPEDREAVRLFARLSTEADIQRLRALAVRGPTSVQVAALSGLARVTIVQGGQRCSWAFLETV